VSFIRRIFKTGWQSFMRNALVSSAAILILFVTISLLTGILLFNALSAKIIGAIKDRVSIGVYFLTNAPEIDILGLKGKLVNLSQVKSVEYVSRTEALKRFRLTHQKDEVINQALDQLGGQNPLPASLTIKADDPKTYPEIVAYIEKSPYANMINEVDFGKRQKAIENISRISDNISRGALLAIIVMALISFLVSFNTLRLAIYNDRHKIGVMRLVGASNNFVRGPFIVQGILYGCVGAFLSFSFWVIGLKLFNASIEAYFTGLGPIALDQYYIGHWIWFLGVTTLCGVSIGVISSVIAVRKHLDV